MAYLDAQGLESTVMHMVLAEAERISEQRRKVMLDDMRNAVQNGVAKAFGG